ncbi:M28 family metallopeptidase [Haloechinothrix sp. LS1_15]|uniref:M28 family metallopeptidase n=1 Tax=Haloechinothrix sp. LS1_15 TaxID=2652248 RepID=UPI0029477EE5|nr:M28 family metallopeptidase [Haloechinothrix sp. LS1_15]MDV6012390.1 M28 family peptidase [Haloechinothrix sp. LS1_15]
MSAIRRKIALPTAIVASAALAVTSGPAALAEQPDTTSELPERVAESLTVGDINRHLTAFQRIAWQHDGHRASGTPGYDRSADYVEGVLERAGFDVTRQKFEFTYFEVLEERLESGNQQHEVHLMRHSPATPEGGLTAPTVVVPESDEPGCDAGDYEGIDVDGAIALIQRGACTFAQKQQVAADEGAVAALIYNNVEGPLHGTLGDPEDARIPTGGVSDTTGADLVYAAGEEATLELRAISEERTTDNVLAETATGATDNVVMAGAHLDSVLEGPGINDNGSGSAALLQAAVEMGPEPEVNNAVRFAWWGAEEVGLVGSTHYVQELDFEEQLDIAMYLNFDMIGSPNGGYFVYDGDGEEFGVPGPHGSAAIEGAFVERLGEQGVETEPSELSMRSDYAEFMNQGIPIGGLFTGAEGVKTEEQAAKWGGTAGQAYDPCYHQACDHLGNLDRQMLLDNAKAAAYVIGSYGLSTEDVNGVGPGDMVSMQQRAAERAGQQLMHAGAASQGHHQAS